MKSSTLAKAETSGEADPVESTKGVMAVAALRISLEVAGVDRSSWRRRRKFAVSAGEMALHPTP
jgi:hypothetical protein